MEIEDVAYVVTLGVDRREDNRLLVTARMAVVQAVGGAGGQKSSATGGPVSFGLVTADAETMNKALYTLNGSSTRRLDLRHLRAVIIGEELARSGIEPLLMEFVRHPQAREAAVLILARGRAFDVMRENLPVIETNPAKMTEGFVLQSKQLHLAPPVYIQKFVARLAAPGGDPFLPVMARNPYIKPLKDQEPPAPAEHSALPGDLARGGGNPVEFIGTAVFRADRLKGFLTIDETQMLLALRGEMGKTYITFPDPLTPDRQLTMRFHQENLPKYQTSYQGRQPRVSVRILFEGELLAVPGGTDYVHQENRVRLEAAAAKYAEGVARDLLAKTQDWGADPVGFGHKFRKRFATWPEWEQYDWPKHIKDLKVDVSMQMRVRRYGLFTGPDRTGGK
jgi:spore germination protein KC